MSSWFRNCRATTLAGLEIRTLGVLIALAVSGVPAVADEYYMQPRADVGVDVDTNRSLVTSGPKPTSVGYDGEVGATVGIATPVSDTTLRPQISYYDYPSLSQSDLEERLDFASAYNSQRAHLGIYGEFDHRDLYGSELASAAFNPLNPNLPTTPETGRISDNGTRTLLTVVPHYEYNLTQRLAFEVSGVYQYIGYAGDDSSDYISYGYYDALARIDWSLTPRSDVSLGVDESRESAKNVYSVTDGRGVDLAYNYQWSKVFSGSLALVVDQFDIYGAPPSPSKVTSSGVGATYTTTWKGQISQLQLTLGRTFTPSGSGGSYTSDQLQIEYKRQFSARVSFDTAGHYIRNVALSSQYESGNYDYLTLTADLRWMLAPTWYLAGGLEYLEDRSPVAGTSASNAMAHVAFGYEGLGRQY
jgi:hypothetical protein